MNSADIASIKLIKNVQKKGNKKVHVDCKNNKEGDSISKAIANNSDYLTQDGWKKMNKGWGYKDFTYVFDTSGEADYFLQRLTDVKNGNVDPEPYSVPVSDSGGGSNSLLIVAGIILIIALVVFVWKRKR